MALVEPCPDVTEDVAAIEDMAAARGPAWLDDWLAHNLKDLVSWRRRIHAHPELSQQEYATTDLVATILTNAGLHPRLLPSATGLICDIGSGDRCVALRADMDALPLTETTGLGYQSTVDGVSHACGHDAHTAMLLAAALALASAPELPGRVRCIFQPAEEVAQGAPEVISAGGLDGVERIFGLHCNPQLAVGQIGTYAGSIAAAADMLVLRLTSPGGHTSRPHLTADLVYALGTVITGLPAMLSRRVDPRAGTVLVWGAVEAGEAANAVPRHGVLRGVVRTSDYATWVELEPLIRDVIHSLLSPTGVGVDLEYRHMAPPVVNDQESTEILRAAVTAALGGQALTTVQPSSGGDDFGWYVKHIPGSYARLGVWSGKGSQHDIHHSTFTLDERALPVGTRVLVHAALQALG